MKDFATTCALIGGVIWLLNQMESAPASVDIPVFSHHILAVPVFLIGMYFAFTGKRAIVGLVLMAAVIWYLFVSGAL